MVKIVTGLQHHREASCQRTLIMEIVGPAGAGKTTLYRTLAKVETGIRTEPLPPVWNIGYIPFFVKHILLLAPALVRMLGKGDRHLTRRELAWMAMLKGWPKILKKKAEEEQKIILLDQGPIFLMAILSEFGPESLRAPDLQGYWQKTNEQWSHTLDIVIWLDAADDILINRIRMRQDEHMVKDKTDQEIKDFLAKYRDSYERLITALKMNNREVRVFKIDTGKNSVDDIARIVLQSFPYGIRDL